jgi:NTP pyrophosphatase (non-canonical NTP hydrolase)
MPNTREILTILIEECAEVIQAASKIQRFGWDGEWKGETNQTALERELGDLICMIALLVKCGAVDQNQLDIFRENKLDKLRVWSKVL